jgi:hypothetical protein
MVADAIRYKTALGLIRIVVTMQSSLRATMPGSTREVRHADCYATKRRS